MFFQRLQSYKFLFKDDRIEKLIGIMLIRNANEEWNFARDDFCILFLQKYDEYGLIYDIYGESIINAGPFDQIW